MRAQIKPQLNNLREFIGKLDSGQSNISTRYKKVLRDEVLQAKRGELAKSHVRRLRD